MAAQDEQHLYSLPYDRVPMESNNYNDLINKPKINGVTLVGEKTLADLGIIIPTKTSELTNDSEFATTSQIPTKTSQLTNDADFATETYVDNAISDLEAALSPLNGIITIKNMSASQSFTSTFDNLATSLTNTLTAIKTALTANQFAEIKTLIINTIGNVKPTSQIIITPSTDILSLVIDWQGMTYKNNILNAIDIVNKKVLSLTMTNDLNDDAFVSYFDDSTTYNFTIEYTLYETISL